MLDTQTPNSPDWWLMRLGNKLRVDSPRFQKLDSYWRGDQPLPFGNRRMREAYRRFQEQSRTNFCKLVTESVLERLRVVGFRSGGAGTDQTDKTAWSWWQSNNLDARSTLVHRAAIVMSRAYVIVGEDPKRPGQPLVTGEDPRQVIIESAPDNDRNVLAALKTWWDDIAAAQRAVIYLPGSLHYYRTTSAVKRFTWDQTQWAPAQWEVDDATYPAGSAPNPLGEVSVVEFRNCPDLFGNTLGEFEDVCSVQDRINTQVLDRLVISAMQAYRQRYASGVSATDENGNPQTTWDPGADLLWIVEDEAAKFGEFNPADLSGILAAVESDVQHLAAVTRTPPAYMLGSIVNASGDALAASEVGLVSKIVERSNEFGDSWEQVYRLCGKVLGADVPDDCEVMWSDPQFRTLTEQAAAQVQLVTAGVPWRTRMEMLGFSPAAIDRMVVERAHDAMLGAIAAPGAPPGATSGSVIPAPIGMPRPAIGAPGGAAAPASAAARSANGPTP